MLDPSCLYPAVNRPALALCRCTSQDLAKDLVAHAARCTLARCDTRKERPDFATESCMYVCMYVGTRKKRLDSATIHGVTHTASVIEPDITQLLRQRLLLLHTRRRRLR